MLEKLFLDIMFFSYNEKSCIYSFFSLTDVLIRSQEYFTYGTRATIIMGCAGRETHDHLEVAEKHPHLRVEMKPT